MLKRPCLAPNNPQISTTALQLCIDNSEASGQNTSLCAAHLWAGTSYRVIMPCGTSLTTHRGTGTGVLHAFAAPQLRWLWRLRFQSNIWIHNWYVDIEY